jgi:hypothetical protein
VSLTDPVNGHAERGAGSVAAAVPRNGGALTIRSKAYPAVATGCAAKRINQALAGAVSESSRRR